MTETFNRLSDSDIIAYKPVLELETVINTEGDTSLFSERESIAHSPSVLQITQNPPNRSLEVLTRMNENIDAMISTLETQLSNVVADDVSFRDYQQALADGDQSAADTFLDYHRNDINGDTRVELYDGLVALHTEASNIQSWISKVMYGTTDITTEDAEAKDNTLINKLNEYENKGLEHKINYAALAFDVQINQVLSRHAEVLQQHANTLFSMAFDAEPEKVSVPSQSVASTVNTIFCDCALKNNDDRKKLNSILKRDLVTEALVNIFNKRSGLLNLLNTKQIVNGIAEGSYIKLLLKSIDDATIKTSDYINELNKAILTSAMYREDYLTTLKQKQDIRNVNSAIS